MIRQRKLWPLTLAAALAAGCGGSVGADASAAAAQQDYGTTKQMVIDILHSAEGRKAIEEMAKDPEFRQKIAVSDTDVAKAVEKTLQTKKSQSFLSEQAKDPQFAAALAKAVQPELIQLQKQLMKDPEYQKDLLVLLKSPDFTKDVQQLLQTPEMRGQIMKIMTEALQTPSFRMQFQDALKRAVAESIQAAGGKQAGGQGQGGGQGGGQGQG
ncbi:MAG: hypothetical protein K6T30_06965, partial [Alicyclobacillus sp.]|nr:hypothetical protein [Alicyclobacillus sp.]